MALKWLWQNLVANWIWYLLTVAAAAVVGWLAVEGSKWVFPALCASGVFVSISVALAALAARTYFRQHTRTEVTTVNNVERLVREWSDTFRFSVKKRGATDSYYWAFELRGPTDIPITGMRGKHLSHYLRVTSALVVDDVKSKTLFAALKKSDADALIAQLRIEMNRLNIANPPERFSVSREIPISHDLTDYRFVTTVNEVTNALLLVRQIFLTALHSGVLLAEGKTPIAPISESAAATATPETK
jgi:hypothetical protein